MRLSTFQRAIPSLQTRLSTWNVNLGGLDFSASPQVIIPSSTIPSIYSTTTIVTQQRGLQKKNHPQPGNSADDLYGVVSENVTLSKANRGLQLGDQKVTT